MSATPGSWVFVIETDPIDVDDDILMDALYDVGLGGSWHPPGAHHELYFDFAADIHPHPSDELSAEAIVRPVLERHGIQVWGWHREDVE